MKILLAGGTGFIGSHLVRLFVTKYPDYRIYNLDALTYAGNIENLNDIKDNQNYSFIKGDVNDASFIDNLFKKYNFDSGIHLAAEFHVDRSITDPLALVKTNILGTVNLLNAAKKNWKDNFSNKLFYHMSTDEVYGSLGTTGLFTENTSYDPNSPYSASKASSDHFVRAYGEANNLPYVITNCSNNYGPNQFPEKLIPLFINNITKNKPLPVYGDGNYTRDWLYVVDHAIAIDLVKVLCKIMDNRLNRVDKTSEKLITYVKDRPGHDLRYAIDSNKINKELCWKPSVAFEEGVAITIDWYLNNEEWLQNITSGDYKEYYEKQYQ